MSSTPAVVPAAAIIPVHRQSLPRNPLDDRAGIGVGRDKTVKVGFAQHQKPAVAQRQHVRLPRLTRYQCHLAKELAAAEPYTPRRQSDLDRARGDKIHRVAAGPGADDAFVRHGKAGPQQFCDKIQLSRVERGEEIEPFDQTARVQADIEARSRFGGVRHGNVTPQIVEQLLRDQSVVEQRLIPRHLLANGGLAKKPQLEGSEIIRVLAAQRVERAAQLFAAAVDDPGDEIGDALPENRA